jgi:hypothetical protein
MLREINLFFEYLNTNNDGKIIRNRIIIITLIIIFALIFSRFVLSPYVSEDLKISLNQSKLLFLNGKSPYDEEIQNYIKGIARDEKWVVNDNYFEFDVPLFQLMIYLPFAVIPDYLWASAFFITINIICIFLTIHMLFHLLKWEPKLVERISIYLLTAAVFFIYKNILSGNSSIIQLTMIIAVIFYEVGKKPILSGIFLGLCFIDPVSMLFTVIVLLVILITKREYSVLFWSIITVGLLSIFSTIFDSNWIIGWLKSLFLTPSRFPFITYIDGIQEKYGMSVNKLFIIIPIILTSWLVLEIFRTPKDTTEEKIWLLSISGLLNYYVMIRTDLYAAVLFFPALILLIGVWWKKLNGLGKLVFYILLTGISAGIFLLQLFSLMEASMRGTAIILITTAFFLVVNLYWARLWIMRPYVIRNSE